MKSAIFLSIREVHGGRAIDVANDSGNARRHMPDSHQFLSLRIWQRFDQDAVYHAEDGRIGADTERQRCECNGGEDGSKRQSPKDIPERFHLTVIRNRTKIRSEKTACKSHRLRSSNEARTAERRPVLHSRVRTNMEGSKCTFNDGTSSVSPHADRNPPELGVRAMVIQN